MTKIANTYINALLADATYVSLLSEPLSSSGNQSLLGSRMTPELAKYIADNFEVASAIDTPDIPLLGSGFDATVWRGRAGTEFAGQVFVSTRGTEPPGVDIWGADADLATNVAARTQIIDMVNWWMRETTPAGGEQAKQVKWDPLRPKPGSAIEVEPGIVWGASVAATGNLANVTNVQINGHSLGGHLASSFARIFGGATQQKGSVTVDGISTFNSAGFNGSNAEFFFAQLQGLLSTGMSSFAGVQAKQTNLFAENGINLTTNDWWFRQMGQRIGLNQEEGTGMPNHSMFKLTDMLALGAAMEKLDSGINIGKLNALMPVGGNQPAASIEGLFDALRRAIEGPGITASSIGDAADSAPSRVDYHAALAKFNLDHKSLAGKLSIGFAAREMETYARNDFAALIALQDLSPIMMQGKDAAGDALLVQQWQGNDIAYGKENSDVLLGGAGDGRLWGGCKSKVAIYSRTARLFQASDWRRYAGQRLHGYATT